MPAPATIPVAAVPGIDYPPDKSVVDVLVASRGETLTSWVEAVSDGGEFHLTVGRDRDQQPVALQTGEHLELVWKAPGELRSLPVELVAVERGNQPTWRVRSTGPAARGQRRSAVRAPLALPLQLTRDGDHLTGVTVDLSEGGFRCVVDPDGDGRTPDPAAPDATQQAATPSAEADVPTVVLQVGDVTQIRLDLDGGELACRAEVVRQHPRDDDRNEVSLRFLGLTERTEDLIRRNVFTCLRDLRARGVM